ncbi:crotonase/enoyl-CoA hydratase family protein [Algiphilus sp.]|jgi:enoyl-CoA hydratase|uniref:crotonase/enoyl-CoA hydratase family protein n=1 Tax=Algiphilus sp. TaxID=1872431 RepID=UPI002A662478|nr:crotonase/enoyl-CoA hydratase family protein [Pseudomonadota bacterium]
MGEARVHYDFSDGIVVIRIDDGKRNALPPAAFHELNAAFDRAEADQAIVILTGREGVFSAGYDLKVLRGGGPQALNMVRLGYSLTPRVLSFPYPVITACSGHALAMGVFLMLCSDYIIGTRGDFKVAANEVALGLPMPRVGAAVLRHRLTPAAFERVVNLSEYFPVEEARDAGFFDEVVAPDQLMARARAHAAAYAELDMRAHAATKRRIRRELIRTLRRSVWVDVAEAAWLGLQAARRKR